MVRFFFVLVILMDLLLLLSVPPLARLLWFRISLVIPDACTEVSFSTGALWDAYFPVGRAFLQAVLVDMVARRLWFLPLRTPSVLLLQRLCLRLLLRLRLLGLELLWMNFSSK